MRIKAEKVENRFGNRMFKCPLCGHVFLKSKQYTKHLVKSHINKGFKNKRLKKKLQKYVETVKEKINRGEELTIFEKVIATKIKLFKL